MALRPSFQAPKPSGVAESEKGEVACVSAGETHLQESSCRQVLGEKRTIRENGSPALGTATCVIVAETEGGRERIAEPEELLNLIVAVPQLTQRFPCSPGLPVHTVGAS